jgi:AhpD family alkylhydroperoxidase
MKKKEKEMKEINRKVEELLKDSDRTIKKIYDEVEKQLGFVPFILKSMSERPEILISSVLNAYFLLGEPKALNRKTAEMIAFACAVTTRGETCMKVHMNEAFKAGATKEEIFEAVMIGSLMAQTAVQASAFKVYQKVIE